jgi:hypothetical protein
MCTARHKLPKLESDEVGAQDSACNRVQLCLARASTFSRKFVRSVVIVVVVIVARETASFNARFASHGALDAAYSGICTIVFAVRSFGVQWQRYHSKVVATAARDRSSFRFALRSTEWNFRSHGSSRCQQHDRSTGWS